MLWSKLSNIRGEIIVILAQKEFNTKITQGGQVIYGES